MAIADAVMRREQAERVPAGRTARAVIEVEDLSLTFETADGPVFALAEVNLTVEAGDFVSFIGPSGCGKTTLLRRSEEHTSELQSLMRISYAVFCLKKKH